MNTADLLVIWEAGATCLPVERALLLLNAACPEASADDIADLPIGRRDALLLTLREWTFGPNVQTVVDCPQCGERLELEFAAADVRLEPATHDLTVIVDGIALDFRLPTSRDLMAVICAAESDYMGLLRRCVPTAPDDLSTEDCQTISAQIAQADPQADVRLDLNCPACANIWQSMFDIGAFFWHELDAWAWHTLHDVHALARGYGWSETEILRLSPRRRQLYLEILQ